MIWNKTENAKMSWQDMKLARKCLDLLQGDNIVLTGGPISGNPGNTNIIKVQQL